MKPVTEHLQSFLDSLDADARDYYEVLFDFILALDPPLTDEYGLALIKLINENDIYFTDGRSLTKHGVYGGIEDAAVAVAVWFGQQRDLGMWWKAQYIRRADDADVATLTKELLWRTLQFPTLESLE